MRTVMVVESREMSRENVSRLVMRHLEQQHRLLEDAKRVDAFVKRKLAAAEKEFEKTFPKQATKYAALGSRVARLRKLSERSSRRIERREQAFDAQLIEPH